MRVLHFTAAKRMFKWKKWTKMDKSIDIGKKNIMIFTI